MGTLNPKCGQFNMKGLVWPLHLSDPLVSVPTSGGPPQGPRLDSHRWEALPLSHLRHPFPPPADPEEPPAHPHRREALLCKSQEHHPLKHQENQTVTTLSHLMNACFFIPPVWKVRPSLPTQEPAASSPPPEARRRHQHQDPLQGADRALPASSAGLLRRTANSVYLNNVQATHKNTWASNREIKL